MRPRATLSLLLLAAVLLALALAPGAAAKFIKGIDVSNHQSRISWGQVPDRFEFAFVKASEGTYFVDSWYERNRRLAQRSGKKVGAYHFARPDGSTSQDARRDGRQEAKFFLDVAAPRRGELLPVLDLEVSGGLEPRLLKAWAKTFVRTIEKQRGVKPMIYTSPFFWQTAMDDTQWFAANGYKALWIAHWETDRPSVPADNWDGRGWTFWQYTDCGQVRGVPTSCVDINKYRFNGFRRVKIRNG